MEGLFLPLLLLLVVAIPLVMGTRKQKRAMAEQQKLQSSLSAGDRVMTTSGLYATVADVTDETTIDLEIAEGVVTTWLRQAVREKIEPTVETDEADAEDSDDDTTTASAELEAKADETEAVDVKADDESEVKADAKPAEAEVKK